ncbi:ParE-like toxin of type II ParDE toxin-antitoxin system [Permianibacter aggregans]|uniref:ParE-like toxin of type II ParDE toxin-antitoxin system n=1 Tax=Permianibacter aggregans TaxID=1510150 RepID=A0A4V6PWU1_9GAMM|nr:ParE-like toxin of type II ParDE toxin-antitoxin system [Permianibacter aggregans]
MFYARHIVNSLIDRSVLLEEFPASGRVVPELGDETVRERLVYSYRLICQIRDNDIQVLALIHQRQHLDADDIPRSQ